MIKLVNFVRCTDKQEKPDIFEACKRAGKLRFDKNTIEEMSARELAFYERMKIEKE
jgi:hypothetical protein